MLVNARWRALFIMSSKKNIKLSLLGDRILVKKVKDTGTKTSGNIILPETAQKDVPYVAEVIAAVKSYCPSRESTVQVDMPVKVGDKVLLPVFGGVPVPNELMGEEDKNVFYLLFSINDVFAKVEE